ncbi:GSCOCG00004756001-RA-CDS, partial [Cotesia congregata]
VFINFFPCSFFGSSSPDSLYSSLGSSTSPLGDPIGVVRLPDSRTKRRYKVQGIRYYFLYLGTIYTHRISFLFHFLSCPFSILFYLCKNPLSRVARPHQFTYSLQALLDIVIRFQKLSFKKLEKKDS